MPGKTEKIELWRQEGNIMIRTPEGKKQVVTGKVIIEEIQKFLFIDFGNLQIRPVRARAHEAKGDVCPYCGSTNTIGHGGRPTKTEYQVRRYCTDCGRTFIAGKEPVRVKQDKDNKKIDSGQVRFLYESCGYEPWDIAVKLGITVEDVQSRVKDVDRDHGGKFKLSKAEKFNKSLLVKEVIGNAVIWDCDGRHELGRKGLKDTVTINKTDEARLMELSGRELQEAVADLTENEQKIIIGYIEDKKDDNLGILPKTRTDTKVSEDGGELDADLLVGGSESEDGAAEAEESCGTD